MELRDFKIYVDPGHGAGDTGAVYNGVEEHATNVIVGNEVARLLRSWGATVKVRDVSQAKFKDKAGCLLIAEDSKDWGADIFLSIHCNDLTYEDEDGILQYDAHGTETFVQRGSASSSYEEDLAERVNNAVMDAIGTSNRGVKECNYNVFNNQTAWCVLTELAALSNSGDAKLLKSSSNLDRISRNIANAIDNFVYANFRNIEKL